MNAKTRVSRPTFNALLLWALPLLIGAGSLPAAAQSEVIPIDGFDDGQGPSRWSTTGDWKFVTATSCLGADVGFTSPSVALVFDYGSTCQYGNNRSGFATLLEPVDLDITYASFKLEWSDYVGAELGADFYFVQVSADEGATWAELFRDSTEEKLWDTESIDLSAYIGQKVLFRFGFESDESITSTGWYIDDVRIVGEKLPAGVSAIAIHDGEVEEGNSGETFLNFPVQVKPENATQTIEVEVSTFSGTAVSGIDFVAKSGTFEIPAGTTEIDLPVQIRVDSVSEGDETFTIRLSNPKNGFVTIAEATGTILDDEEPVCLYEEDFEVPDLSFRWTTGYPGIQPPTATDLGLWQIATNANCIDGSSDYVSPTAALAYTNTATCSYDLSLGGSGATSMINGENLSQDDALTAELSFQHYLEIAYTSIQPLVTTAYVEVSTTGGAPWDILATYAPPAPSATNFVIPWEEERISLNDYIGGPVFIRFRFEQPDEANAHTANGWFIDDFKICYGERPDTVSKAFIDPVMQNEGNAGTTVFNFPLELRQVNTQDILLAYETFPLVGEDASLVEPGNSAAAPDEDFTSVTAQVSIPAGDQLVDLPVLVIGDDRPGEGNRQFGVRITALSDNVFLENAVALGTIVDDDLPSEVARIYKLNSNPATDIVNETDGVVAFVADLCPAGTPNCPGRSVPITMNFTTLNHPDETKHRAFAGQNLDYEFATGTITFPPNTTKARFFVRIQDDQFFEPNALNVPEDEVFQIKFTTDSPFAVGTDHNVFIHDNETGNPPGVSNVGFAASRVPATEGSCEGVSSPTPCGDTLPVTVTVELESPATQVVQMNYATENGTALAGQDYVAKSGSLSIAIGQDEFDIVIDVMADRAQEVDEAFSVVLTNPNQWGNIRNNTAVVTIRDDDFVSTTFGVNGNRVMRRAVNESASTEHVETDTHDLAAADFRAYDFTRVYGFEGLRLYRFDLARKNKLNSPDLPVAMTGLTWDQTSGVAYASSATDLYTIDIQNIGSPNPQIIAITNATGEAFNPVALASHPTTGVLYIVSVTGAEVHLFSVVPGSWKLRLQGQVKYQGTPAVDVLPSTSGVVGNEMWSMDFDDATGVLYLNAYTSEEKWLNLVVDPELATALVLVEEPAVSSLAIASSPAPDAVQWTRDLEFADASPAGIDLDGGSGLNGKLTGAVVGGVGDVNGDKFDDFIVTASDADVVLGPITATKAGRAFVIFGGNSDSSSEILNRLNENVAFESLLNPSTGFAINGSVPNERLGVSATGLSDFNGDNIADFAIGYYGANGEGGVYVIFGGRNLGATSVASTAIGTAGRPGLKITGATPLALPSTQPAGPAVSGAGDFNNDGIADLLIGAPGHDAGPRVNSGAAYVIFGSGAGFTSSNINLVSLVSPRGQVFIGEFANNLFGSSVTGAGDVNGDGVDDIVITGTGVDNPVRTVSNDTGAAYVLFGHVDYGVDTDLDTLDLVLLEEDVSLGTGVSVAALLFENAVPPKGELFESLQASVTDGKSGELPGYKIVGGGGGFGARAEGLGDFDGDGFMDFAVLAPTYDGSNATITVNGATRDNPHWGRAYMVFGDETNSTETPAASISSRGVILEGVNLGDLNGDSFAGAGDVNGDGLTDVLIGAMSATPAPSEGEAYLLYGRESMPGELPLRQLADSALSADYGTYIYNTHTGAEYENFGRSVGAAGDFDDDGVSDFVIGRENGAFVLLGSAITDTGVFRNRMRSGKSFLQVPGGPPQGTDLGENVKARVGGMAEGSISRPLSRVAIDFKGGGTGTDGFAPSTQTVTLFRKASPDLIVGDGGAEDDARWIPGGVYWKLETNRTQFTESTLTFYYRPDELRGEDGTPFDTSKVRIYFSKQVPSPTTTWTLLDNPDWDSDNGTYTIHRKHTNPQAEFNGYYAIVQADFVIELGDPIPVVGLTSDNVYPQGPEMSVAGLAFWHGKTDRLYAIADGAMTVTWKDATGNEATKVDVTLVWPDDDDPRFQNYVVGTPPVSLDFINGKPVMFGLMTDSDDLQDPINTALRVSAASNKQFTAGLAANDNSGRALVMLGDAANAADDANLFFQFVRPVKWDNPNYRTLNVPIDIGRLVGPEAGSVYAAQHDELAGSPYVLFEDGPYAAASLRYDGFYNRGTRSGSIVFVNTPMGSQADPVLVFYQRGTKLVDGLTGELVENPQTEQPAATFAWPHYSAQYKPQWPNSSDNDTIIISRQDGSREISPTLYGTEIDLYYQNSGTIGFNPNEEHALIAPYGSGNAVFALRNDLNVHPTTTVATSQPYVLMTYKDPGDLVLGQPRAKMRALKVLASTVAYPFSNWPGVNRPQDPYEGVAGSPVFPIYPLSILPLSAENRSFNFGNAWRDRNNMNWAVSSGNIQMRFYYPVLEGFYFPQFYRDRHPTRTFAVGNKNVPFLDDNQGTPRLVTYSVGWPVDVPEMGLGEILLTARDGLPSVNGQCSVLKVNEELLPAAGSGQLPISKLMDPIGERSVPFTGEDLPADVEQAIAGSEISFPGLPPALSFRITYDPQGKRLICRGKLVEPTLGDSYVLLNVLTQKDLTLLKDLSADSGANGQAWDNAATALYNATKDTIDIPFADSNGNYIEVDPSDFESVALSTANAAGVGYVVLAFQNAQSCAPLPVSVEIIKVTPDLSPGSLAVVKPRCVFEERLGLMHTSDFAGKPDNFEFEWQYRPSDGALPGLPDTLTEAEELAQGAEDGWSVPDLSPVAGVGVNEITIQGPGLLTLTDNWFSVRFRRKADSSGQFPPPFGNRWSSWTQAQLAPGWIKRVVGEINPFTQRAVGGGIEGAEASFASFSSNAPNVLGNMISMAGPRYEGSVPLNCENLDAFGLLEIYGTVLDRGATLSINALPPINHPGVNNALLLVASRISDLYLLLGNEAYADASDPTIAWGTDDGEYGAEATSIHAFMNQTSSLLEEELSLLRGRDETYSPGVQLTPVYNRLIWNFTTDFTGGEVAYALNYNLADAVVGGDGVISEADAKDAFPQGHGDAWGHYLTAMGTYYKLLRHPFYAWTARSEEVLVGGQAVSVDFIDERKFARAAAAKARTGTEIVNLAYRQAYVEDPKAQWNSLTDTKTNRAWGFNDWAQRAGQGTYLDWVVANAIVPAVAPPTRDPDTGQPVPATGIRKIDRTTVAELHELPGAYMQIQTQADSADQGLNPLGLGTNVVPFDISPSEIDDGLTHFEQIYGRALTSVGNAVTAFNNANNSTQLLRRQADTQLAYERSVQDAEIDFNSRLIELFGTPYPEDIGPGGSYPRGYEGPDIFHYMYSEETPIYRDSSAKATYFTPGDASVPNNTENIPTFAESLMPDLVSIGPGQFVVDVKVNNYGAVVGSSVTTPEDVLFPNSLDGILTVLDDDREDATTGDDTIESLPTADGNTTFNNVQMTVARPITVQFHLALDSNGRIGIRKPTAWTGQRRSTGSIQQAQSEVAQSLAGLASAVSSYEEFLANVDIDTKILEEQFNVNGEKLYLKSERLDQKKDFQRAITAMKALSVAFKAGARIAEKLGAYFAESVPQVTGIIIGFSNGIIVDALAPARGALEGAGGVAAEVLLLLGDATDIIALGLEVTETINDAQLEFDLDELDLNFEVFTAVKELEKSLRAEPALRFAMYSAYEATAQALANYNTTVAEAQRTLEQLDIFRKRTSADIQTRRYKDMAFRLFRNEQLQKYRAQYDLAAQYTYLAAKAYDYETTMLTNDPRAGERFLTDIVKARQLGTFVDGEPQPGQGLANSLAVMSRNFGVLRSQLGFNNPQVETNRFSLRYEKYRQLVGPAGDESWRALLDSPYEDDGVGVVDDLWTEVPEYAQYCVPAGPVTTKEPALVISFSTEVNEGSNFFGESSGGFDNSYDSTQFATKIRSAGIWFSNYDFFSLSNTPRVYLVPVGLDSMRSPTGATGTVRTFKVLDQLLPVPYPIGQADLDRPTWIPNVDGLDGNFLAPRRYGRLRAYHDSGEFSEDEVNRDSRLIGRSVWNSKWLLIIPGRTLNTDPEFGLDAFINGPNGDGNGVKDIKIFFETYAYPRVKSAGGVGGKEADAATAVTVETSGVPAE